MITISNCPITGLKRKLTYDFYWLSSQNKIVIQCYVNYYDESDNIIETAGIKSFQRCLTASDSLVDKTNGHIYTDLELSEMSDEEKEQNTMHEYDFYVYVLGITPLILPQLISQIILQRDSENKFDI